MNKLSLNQMENVQGGKPKAIPKEICAAAFIVSLFGPIGLAIGGPTSLGCLIKGEGWA